MDGVPAEPDEVADRPEAGAPCVVLGRHIKTEGRKTQTTSTLYGPDGQRLAQADAVWIAVDPTSVRPPLLKG